MKLNTTPGLCVHTSIINCKIHNFASIHLLCMLLTTKYICHLPVNPIGRIRTGKYECHVWEPGIWDLLSHDNHLGSAHGWVVTPTLHYTCWQLPLSWPMVGLITDQQICLILDSAVEQVFFSASRGGDLLQMCPICQGQQWNQRPDTPTLCSYTWPITLTHHTDPSHWPTTLTRHTDPVTLTRHTDPSHWPITLTHLTDPSHWPITLTHHTDPSHWTISLTHDTDPSHWPITLTHHTDPSHWPITLTHLTDPSHWPITLTHHTDPSHWPGTDSHRTITQRRKKIIINFTEEQTG